MSPWSVRTRVSGASPRRTPPEFVSSKRPLEPGPYKITVQKEGFKTYQFFGVTLRAGAATRADCELPVGSIQDTVIVRGVAPMLDRIGCLHRRRL